MGGALYSERHIQSFRGGRRNRRQTTTGGCDGVRPASGHARDDRMPRMIAVLADERPEEQRGPGVPGDAGPGDSTPRASTPPPPPPAREWTALWAAPRGDNDAPAAPRTTAPATEARPTSEGEPHADVAAHETAEDS